MSVHYYCRHGHGCQHYFIVSTTQNMISQETVFVLILLACKRVVGLKCYQCSTLTDRGCFNYNLDEKHLKSCEEKGGVEPVCRALSQVQFFMPHTEVVLIRECAYIYIQPLKCVQSQNKAHHSISCECSEDGCNRALRVNYTLLLWFISLFIVVML